MTGFADNGRILLAKHRMTEDLALMPPLGLGFIATALRQAGFTAAITDCMLSRLAPAQLAEACASWRADVVGLSIISRDLTEAQREIAAVKARSPKTLVVIGGPHVSAIPRDSMRFFEQADYGVCGEGELSFTRLVQSLAVGSKSVAEIPGVLWREGGEIRQTPPQRIMNLAELGIPAWDLLQPQNYPHSPTTVFVKRLPTAPIQISRGCLYPCRFCASKGIYGYHFRHRELESVIEEMKLLERDFGIREFQLIDDNFFQRPEVVKRFCELLLQSNLATVWHFPNGVRLDYVDRELARLLKRSGCYRVSVGVDSGSPAILKAMNKRITKDALRQKVKLMRQEGIEVLGHCIIGYPGETVQDVAATIRFARSLPLNFAGFSHFAAMPGSDEGAKFWRESGHDMNVFEHTSFYRPEYSHTAFISACELARLKKTAYLKFYLRPSILLHLASRIRSVQHLKTVLKRVAFLLKNEDVRRQSD